MNARLALLDSVEQGVTEGEVLRLALQHAVAELDGLGGTVHLRGPMSALLAGWLMDLLTDDPGVDSVVC
ncbi:hypothetical protein, partial [Streptomyces sp. NPDC005167]